MADVPAPATIAAPWRLSLAIFCTAAILTLSLWPAPKLPVQISHGDLYAHGFLYLLLALTWLKLPLHWTLVIPTVTIFGLLMEIAQHFIPGRTFSIADILANFIGAAAALLTVQLCQKFSS